MNYVIVPSHVQEAINYEIERFLKVYPYLDGERDSMYSNLLAAYNDTGKIAKLSYSLDDGLDDAVIGALP